jgi:hypothetical protein
MVKLYVKQRFADKETKAIHEPNSVIEVTEERFAEIAENLGPDFVAKVTLEELESTDSKEEAEKEASEFPKTLKGGYYELSDGSKVRGKEAAVEAENALLMK